MTARQMRISQIRLNMPIAFALYNRRDLHRRIAEIALSSLFNYFSEKFIIYLIFYNVNTHHRSRRVVGHWTSSYGTFLPWGREAPSVLVLVAAHCMHCKITPAGLDRREVEESPFQIRNENSNRRKLRLNQFLPINVLAQPTLSIVVLVDCPREFWHPIVFAAQSHLLYVVAVPDK